MKIINSFILALLLIVFSATMSLAAITQVDGSGPGYVRTTITATNTTNSAGDNCIGVHGFIWKSAIADEVSGTAVWNIEFSNDFGTTYAALVTGEAADNSYEFSTAATNVCVHVTTCSTCVLKVTIYGQNAR